MATPNNVHTFQIDIVDEDTGTRLQGTFTTRRMSIKDIGAVGVKKTQLCGGMYCVRDDNGAPTGQGIDEETEWLNGMIAHLEICLMQKPIWFKLEDITNIEIVRAVYAEVMKFENSYKSRRRPAADQGSDGVRPQEGVAQPAQANTGSAPTPVVGQKVSSALDA